MNKKQILIFMILVFFIICIIILGSFYCSKKNEIKDYSLVFDAIFYADANPDINEVCQNDEQKLLEHFVNFGMQEGRRASLNFNLYYYQENNPDLVQAFGDNVKDYYEHYIVCGYQEGRKGSKEDYNAQFENELFCELESDEVLKISIKPKHNHFRKYYILEMPAYENDINQAQIIAEGRFLHDKKVKINEDCLTNKYVLVQKQEDQYQIISNFAYIQNPEMMCHVENNIVIPKSKKGLQVSLGVLDDVPNLEPSYVFTNIFIQKILLFEDIDNTAIKYDYKGKTYYFNQDNVKEYDEMISNFTQKGMYVIASLLSMKAEGYDVLYYPEVSTDTNASYYAINTTNEQSTQYFEAFVAFVSERYNGSHPEYGTVAKWIIGNEVNESATYNYMGEKNIEDYIDEYERTFRIAYNIIKSKNAKADLYVPLEPWWGIDSDNLTYGGREFTAILNKKFKEKGNIDWGLAYHAYSYPLSDPKVTNDNVPLPDEKGELIPDLVTKNSFYTAMITMENIDVLTKFMNQKDFLKDNGQVRSIILSEQGYTANSNVYGKCEALQAASLLYAYYKAEMNVDIDAFIYFLQKDDERASLGNDYYQFGLSYLENNKLHKRLAYSVFENMDKSDSLEKLKYIKDILDIQDFQEIIPNFDNKIFDKFPKSTQTNKNKKSLENAEIKAITNQKYTGQEILPEIYVQLEGRELINDVDYDVVYLNNVECGEASVVIVGLGEFKGIQKAKFMIEN